MRPTRQAPPEPGAEVEWVARHLGDVTAEGADEVAPSPMFRGGQSSADAALAALDITGYARSRNEVWPERRQGASRMSPYIRHGLLPLTTVWQAVADAPAADREKYRDELLWAEYARHVYARVGADLARALRYEPPRSSLHLDEPWSREMACMDLVVGGLETNGWMVNQTRMWLASQWTIRGGRDWREGEDAFFTHLLDGSRAANRLGWQWTVGAGTGKPYGFSRWQVRKRAPGLCDTCRLRRECPIEDWPGDESGVAVDPPVGLRHPTSATGPGAGPAGMEGTDEPDAVWMTFESMGDSDPAMAAHPTLPVVVVFDRPLLARLRLSGKRLVFLAETVAELAARREVEVYVDDPVAVLLDRAVSVTWAPVPGFVRRAAAIQPVEVHPWPWLSRPGSGPAGSFTAWRRAVGR